MGHLGGLVNAVILTLLGICSGYALRAAYSNSFLIGILWVMPGISFLPGVFRLPPRKTRTTFADWVKPVILDQVQDTFVFSLSLGITSGLPILVLSAGLVMQALLIVSTGTALFRGIASGELLNPLNNGWTRYRSLLRGVLLSQVWWFAGMALAICLFGQDEVASHMMAGGVAVSIGSLWNLWSGWRHSQRLSC